MHIEEGLDFDDVLIYPSTLSSVKSREDVILDESYKTKVGASVLLKPIFSAPMKRVSEPNIFEIFMEHGIRPIYHRFDDKKTREETIRNLNKLGKPFGIAVGASQDEINFGARMYANFENLEWVCIDIANGYLQLFDKLTIGIPKSALIMGNVVSSVGFEYLSKYSSYVRVGIGSGYQCITRETTGIGCPQLTALSNCVKSFSDSFIIADGGIRSAADIVKAMVFGADYVMIGSFFGSAVELDNDYIFGMAFRELQEEYYHSVKSVEGLATKIMKKRPLDDIITDLFWNLKSACTYLNVTSLSKLPYINVEIVKINRSSLKNV